MKTIRQSGATGNAIAEALGRIKHTGYLTLGTKQLVLAVQEQSNVTDKQLAEKLIVSPTAISRWRHKNSGETFLVSRLIAFAAELLSKGKKANA